MHQEAKVRTLAPGDPNGQGFGRTPTTSPALCQWLRNRRLPAEPEPNAELSHDRGVGHEVGRRGGTRMSSPHTDKARSKSRAYPLVQLSPRAAPEQGRSLPPGRNGRKQAKVDFGPSRALPLSIAQPQRAQAPPHRKPACLKSGRQNGVTVVCGGYTPERGSKGFFAPF